MGRNFAQLAFTPGVKQQQQKHGSRHLYAGRLLYSVSQRDRLALRPVPRRRKGIFAGLG